jgi:hypothetical protein
MHVRFWNPQDPGDKKRPPAEELENLEPLLSLADEMVGAVRPRYETKDAGDGSKTVHIARRWLRDLRVALRQNADLALIANGPLCRSH